LRVQILLMSAENVGTDAIMRETGKSKTCVRRRPQRFRPRAFEGLVRDTTRPSRIAWLDASIAERVVALTSKVG
jgi:hypothetical protein